jgi:hypothetical protein
VRQTALNACFSNTACRPITGLRGGVLAQKTSMSKADTFFARAVQGVEFRQLFDQVAIFTEPFVCADFCNAQASLVQVGPCQLQLSNQIYKSMFGVWFQRTVSKLRIKCEYCWQMIKNWFATRLLRSCGKRMA